MNPKIHCPQPKAFSESQTKLDSSVWGCQAWYGIVVEGCMGMPKLAALSSPLLNSKARSPAVPTGCAILGRFTRSPSCYFTCESWALPSRQLYQDGSQVNGQLLTMVTGTRVGVEMGGQDWNDFSCTC